MKKTDTATKEILLSKKQLLQDAREQLKREFFGIDEIIDKIIDTIQTWYLMPDMQERPVIINLWGLTGVGKTALISRMADLIGYGNKFYRFDLGEASNNDWKIKSTLRELYEDQNSRPSIICLDEFQYGNTKNPQGEIDKSSSRVVWDLLDNGKFQFTRYSNYCERIAKLKRKLIELDFGKFKVENGMVTEGKDYFLSKTEPDYRINKKQVEPCDNMEARFIAERYYITLQEMTYPKFNSKIQLREALLKMNFEESLKFLEVALELGYGPKTIDCTKCLIFVLGNLDEVYHMSGELSPDINADEYRKISKRINVTHVKNALKKRFKNEQIARLGNNHFIYPALGEKDYQNIIANELHKYKLQLFEKHGISIQFDASVEEILYKEGVFPTQGTRPIFTTIQQLIGAQLGNIIAHQLTSDVVADSVQIQYASSNLEVSYMQSDKAMETLSIPLHLSLHKLRSNKKNDEQAIVAVHESGHALLAILLKKMIPISVYSVSADSEMGGFTFISDEEKLLTKKQVTQHLAFLLGGMAAEKLIFGSENSTMGSQTDIQRATGLATTIIKDCGLGKITASIKSKSANTDYHLHDDSVNEEIKELLANAMQLAETTLKEYKWFLIELSQLLIEKTNIQEAELRALVIARGLESFLKKDFAPLEILQQLSANKQTELFSSNSICLNYDNVPKQP